MNRKRTLRPTFIRAWREFRGLTLQKLADRVAEIVGDDDFSHAPLSRIERGKIAYTQPRLEALAIALNCEPVDLLIRNPLDKSSLWSIYDQLKNVDKPTQDRVSAIIDALAKTGS
jgi:transcriptional regulator with XRE-family HTH domain